VHHSDEPYLPPRTNVLLAWSTLFRSAGTWRNYSGYVKTCCIALGYSTKVRVVFISFTVSLIVVLQVFDEPALKRATRSIRARGSFQPRRKMWITLAVIERMMIWVRNNKGRDRFVLLFAITYIFLLRLPSESLPMVIGPVESSNEQSVLVCEEDQIELHLARRKNKPFGSTLVRSCWCGISKSTCPVHIFGRALRKFPKGTRLFSNINAKNALSELRDLLASLAIEDARLYRTHDLRRGHVLDLQASGKNMCNLLPWCVCA